MAGKRKGQAGSGMSNWIGRTKQAIADHPSATRWLLAGPGAVAAALAFMCAMPVWLPAGAAGVNDIAYPLVLAPLFWAVAFTYACIEENLPRGVAVIAGSTVVQGIVVWLAMAGGGGA